MSEITFMGQTITTCGNLPKIGMQAPDFTVTKTDLSEVRLKNFSGHKMILNIFPSMDTTTCASAMIRFNQIASKYPDILVLCISADLPFAQKRFCAAEHLDNVQPASVFRHPSFGEDYGVTIIDGPLAGLLSRAVIIVDENGKVIYTQHVKEIVDEPNYDEIAQVLAKS